MMRVLWVSLALLLCILGVVSHSNPEALIQNPRDDGVTWSTSRSLKSIVPNRGTAIVAALDGTINLIDSDTQRVIWSFPSGPRLHSSYQAPVNQDNDQENSSESSRFFIDTGDDWELYMYSDHLGKTKLSVNIEDFIKNTPVISEDGSITIGSRKSTVFEVDALTGRLIRTFGLTDSLSTTLSNMERTALDNDEVNDLLESGSIDANIERNALHKEKIKDLVESGSIGSDIVQQRLTITRTDYFLQTFAPNSDRVLWNMSVADIGAALICHVDQYPLSEVAMDSRLQLGSESVEPFMMPLTCHSKVKVFRFSNPGKFDSFPRQHLNPSMQLPGPKQPELLPQQPNLDKPMSSLPYNDMLPPPYIEHPKGEILTLLIPVINNYEVVNKEEETHDADVSSKYFDWSVPILLLVLISLTVGFIYGYARKTREHAKQVGESNLKTPSKKKKACNPGRTNGSPQSKERHLSTENNEDEGANAQGEDDIWKKLNKIVEGSLDGRRIGKLFVSNTEIAKGSNGTIVLEGIYEGRPVAVKRLVKAHNDVAIKEIENLIASDRHPNIVRWYGLEFDQDFVYVSLERCICSLDDMIQIFSDSNKDSMFSKDPSSQAMIEYKVRLDSVRDTLEHLNLWKPNGHPSPLLLRLMRDVVSGLVHLHDLGIIHRDLKPQNVLINKERSLCAKLSDMGISRRLHANMSSLGYHATGCGSSGWQAPEQLLQERQTRAVDVFSLGCVLFFCITGGRHPFGDRFERDVNIVKNKMDLFLVESMPEAVDLFSRLLNRDPGLRPKAVEVLHHPLFWTSERKLSFLRDMSDRVELEDRETESDLLKALEKTAPLALGGKWDEKMEPEFLANICRYRRYKYDNVRDLLRAMRNKLSHYRELPDEIKELLGPVPEGFDSYFAGRFPRLLIEVYKVACTHCAEEECFQKYFRSEEDL